MKSVSISRWLTLGALVLTIAVAIAPFASGQQTASSVANQNVLVAMVDPAPTAPVALATATSTVAAPAPPPPSSGNRWTGFYVGVNVGHGTANGDTNVNPLPTAAQFVNLLPQTLSPDPSGQLGGLQAGYNWQHGHLVFGFEADVAAAGVDGTFVESPIIQNNNTPFPGSSANGGNSVTVHEHMDMFATVRPRIGFAFGHVLLYGTGGLAIGHVGYNANTNFTPVGTTQYFANFSKTQKTATYGGGAEVGFGGHWSVKGEYLQYDFGTETRTVNALPLLPPFQVAYTWQMNGNIFRFGVNYKF